MCYVYAEGNTVLLTARIEPRVDDLGILRINTHPGWAYGFMQEIPYSNVGNTLRYSNKALFAIQKKWIQA